jgi:chromosome segregation ATPase
MSVNNLNHSELISYGQLEKQLAESNNLVRYYKDLVTKKEQSLSQSRSMMFQLESSLANPKTSVQGVEDQSMVRLYQNKFSQVLAEKRKLEKDLKDKKKSYSAVISQLKIDLELTKEEVAHQKIMSNPNQDLVKNLHNKIIHLKSQIEKANRADELEKQVSDLQSKLKIAQTERDSCLNSEKSLSKQVEDYLAELKNQTMILSAVKASNAELMSEKAEYASIIVELKKEILKSSGQNCIQKMQLRELEVLIDDKEIALRKASESYEKTNSEYNELKESHLNKLNFLNENISSLQEKLSFVTAEKQSIECQVYEKNSNINMLESQLKSAELELAMSVNIANQCTETSKNLSNDILYLNGRLNSLQQALLQSTTHEELLKTQLENKNAQILELELKYETELNDTEDLESRLVTMVGVSEKFQTEINRLRADLQVTKAEKEHLSDSYEALRDMNSQYIGTIDDLRASVSRLSNAFDLLKEHDDEVERAYEKTRDYNIILSDSLEATKIQLEIDNDNFSLKLKKVTDELESAKFQATLTTGLRNDVLDLTNKLEMIKTSHELELNTFKNTLQNELNVEKMNCGLLSDSVKLLASELDKSRNEVRALNEAKTSVETQLKTAESQCETLKNQISKNEDEFVSQMKAVQEQLKDVQKQFETEKIAVTLLRVTNEELNNRLHTKTLECNASVLSLTDLAVLNSKHNKDLNELKTSNISLKNELQYAKDWCAMYTKSAELLETELDTLRRNQRALEEKSAAAEIASMLNITDLNKKLKFHRDMEIYYSTLQAENAKNKEQLSQMESKLVECTRKTEVLQKQLEQYDTPGKDAKKTMNTIVSELIATVPTIPEFNSPENEEWELVDDDHNDDHNDHRNDDHNDFESVSETEAVTPTTTAETIN